MSAPTNPTPTTAQRALSWTLAAFTSLYVGGTCWALAKNAPVMRQMLVDLGAEVGPGTSAVLAACRPVILVPVALAIVGFLVGKELAMKSVVTRGLVTMIVFVAWSCVTALVGHALQQPMSDLVTKIGG